ncbi:signal peptidase I [Bovifimicola ammoniilytica]|uniref:signal peptidase I n=1 Tax=Bovifimicola ammoniilytica TaxID=2981720 RepID=UPI0011CC9D3B|nr:signal peptidase I [Bovifimicola ammoniilytica]MCU6753241.1 signal peptidase I [Bovifimicola ammoniilytica]
MEESRKNKNLIPIPTPEEVNAEKERIEHRKKQFRIIFNIIYILIVIVAIASLVATLVLPVLQVSGKSMEPSLDDDDIVVLYKTNKFKTGDICGFYWQNKLLLKRVIAGPLDVVEIDDEGNVKVNGKVIDEPYVNEKALGESNITYPFQVPEDKYFVLGDNRSVSIDSRNTIIGCVDKDQIAGKVMIRIWPLRKLGKVN